MDKILKCSLLENIGTNSHTSSYYALTYARLFHERTVFTLTVHYKLWRFSSEKSGRNSKFKTRFNFFLFLDFFFSYQISFFFIFSISDVVSSRWLKMTQSNKKQQKLLHALWLLF